LAFDFGSKILPVFWPLYEAAFGEKVFE